MRAFSRNNQRKTLDVPNGMPVIRANYVRMSSSARRYDKLHRAGGRVFRTTSSEPTRAMIFSESADDFDLLL